MIASIWVIIVLLLLGNNVDTIDDALQNNMWASTLLSLLVASVSIGFIWAILRYYKKKPLLYLGLKWPRFTSAFLWHVVKAYVLYFFCLIVVMLILDGLTPINVEQQQELGIRDPRSFVEYAHIFVMLVIIPPLFEEILFRGFLYRTLRKWLSVYGAAVITSVLFGMAHLEYANLNWVAAIDTLIFSGFLIYLVEKQDSIYGAIVLHAIKNALAFFVLFVSD